MSRLKPKEQTVKRISFNDNYGCFSCTTKNYLRIFNTNPLQEISEIDTTMFGSIFLCEMLRRTNLIAIVTTNEPNTFQFYDDCRKKIKMRITFSQIICGIRFRQNLMAIMLRSETHVYKLNFQGDVFVKPTPLFSFLTFDNHMGLCDITPSDTSPFQFIVSPFMDKGAVYIMNLKNSKTSSYRDKNFIAHKESLSAIVLNFRGNWLATTSKKGTIIRIWDTANKSKIMEFRRGTNPATIYSVNFSQDSQYIACCSDKGTVHIFSTANTNSLSIRSFVDANRSIATFATNCECKFLCAFIKSDMIIALGLDGTFRRYSIENNKCKLIEYENFVELCANIVQHENDGNDTVE